MRRLAVAGEFEHLAALHYEHDVANGRDVVERVAFHGDQVRLEVRRDRADFLA